MILCGACGTGYHMQGLPIYTTHGLFPEEQVRGPLRTAVWQLQQNMHHNANQRQMPRGYQDQGAECDVVGPYVGA
jgi:hypothetical protein